MVHCGQLLTGISGGELIDISAGHFVMTLQNRRNQSLMLKGYGAGAGAGVGIGLSPVDNSGDLPSLVESIAANSPLGSLKAAMRTAAAWLSSPSDALDWNSPIFLVSPTIDSAQMFGGGLKA